MLHICPKNAYWLNVYFDSNTTQAICNFVAMILTAKL